MEITHEHIKGLTAKIYRGENASTWEYTLVYYNQTGERKRIASRDLAALEARAVEILNDLAGGRAADQNALTAHEREELANLKAIFAEVNAAPLIGARHFVEAVKLMGSDLVIEAARDYQRRNLHKAADITIKVAIAEFIAAKSAPERVSDIWAT